MKMPARRSGSTSTRPRARRSRSHRWMRWTRPTERWRSAASAFEAWSQTPVGDRIQHLFRYKTILEDHAEELAAILVREHGKTMGESVGSVRRGIDCIEHACAAPVLMMGRTLPQIAVSSSFCRTEDEGASARLVRRPHAARGVRRDHPVQLPDHGADVDVADGGRLRKHLRLEALGEGSDLRGSDDRVGA